MADTTAAADPYSWDAWEPGAQTAQGAQGAQLSQRDADIADLNSAIYSNETNSGQNVHTSSAGARGPMQIMPSTFEQYAQPGEDIDNPGDNMAVGHRIISDLYDRYGGDKNAVLIGYNAGEAHIGQPFRALPAETQNYLAKAHQQFARNDATEPLTATDASPTLAHIAGAQAPALAQQIGVDPNSQLDLADPQTRQALNDAGLNPDPYRPIPAPQPRQPGVTEPKVIGPFRNSYDAYEAAPKDRNNYYLLNRGGSYLWQPKGPGVPADQDPTKASPYLDDTTAGQAMNQKVFQAPGLAGNQVSNGVTNIGRAFNHYMSAILDLPAVAADWGLNAIAAGTGYKPTFQFGHPVEGLMNRLGFETDHRGDDGWANFGWGIGSGLGMAATAAIPGAAAAGKVADVGEAAAGPVTTALARGTGFGRGVTTGTAANELAMGGAAGLGQEEAHEFYKSQTGREGDLGDVLSQFLGGGAFNAVRIPLFAAAEKAGLTAVGQAWQGAKAGIASLKGGAGEAADAPLNAVTGKQVTDQVLEEQLARHLDHADQTVAALGTASPADSANYLAERSTAARSAVSTFAQNTRAEERAMWAEVNPSTQIDYSATRQQYQAEKAAHFGAGPGTLRATEDFPTWLEPLLGSKAPGVQQATGLLDANGQPLMRTTNAAGDALSDIDTLGRGQNLRSRINQAIEDERSASGRAQNPALIGYMQRIRNSLGQDMQNTAGGVDNAEIDAYRRAMAYSQSRSQIMESEPMSQFLSQRVGDASALQKFLRQGPAGADAVKAMLGAAQAKYGSGGLLSASKDAIRQMYTDAVAPHGYVDVNAHNAFMKNYGAVLNDPEFADVQQQLNTAAAAARNVNNAVGVGNPTNFGRSESALDARTAAAQNYLDAPTETVLRNLQGSSNALHSTLRVLDQLDTADATGRAGLGFQHQVAQMGLDNPGWGGSNQGIINAIDRRNPDFATRFQKYTTPGTFAGIVNQVYNMATAWMGARIGGHLGEGLGSSLVLAGRGAKLTEGMGQQLKNTATRISSANIVDPAADAAWERLTSANQGRLYTAAQKAQDMVLMHSYVPGLALGNLPIGSGTGTGDAGDRMGPPPGSVPWQQVVPR